MSARSKSFSITTAIDYVNSLPHIGTAYEKIGADVIARAKRMDGFHVYFQMGNDEHSTNVSKAAQKAGLDPIAYCNRMRKEFEATWKKLNISYDGFVQTTDAAHKVAVQKLFQTLYDKGMIEKRLYKGWYCESCEAFYTAKDLVGGLCPHHQSKPKWLEEENYFFKLSEYASKLRAHIEQHSEFILPESRRNEILRVIDEGLKDVSISRASVDWGIPVPFDPSHAVYVWFDALINYISGVGFPKDQKRFAKWWPADMHIIGKDITRFHCIIWPAMLMAADLPLPHCIFGHGFVYLKGERMSKTLGNVVAPLDVVDTYGADALRYYLLRTSSFGNDGDFTWEDFIRRYNGDLANGLGNMVSRTLGMIHQYLGGTLPARKEKTEQSTLAKKAHDLSKKIRNAVDEWGKNDKDIEFHNLLGSIWELLSGIDGYINEHKPWALNKQGKTKEIEDVLFRVMEAIRIVAILLKPFLPSTAESIWKQCGFEALGAFEDQTFDDASAEKSITKKITVKKAETLFPRIEMKEKEKKMETTDTIDIADFAKVDLRIAEIKTAEKIEGADKLLKLTVSLGNEERQLVAGIAKHYTPEELIGKKVVVVANLKPAKLRGVESQGMILCASDETNLKILSPLGDISSGAKVK